MDSSWLDAAADTHATNKVREVPPSESCSKRVSLLSRNGMCTGACAPVTSGLWSSLDPSGSLGLVFVCFNLARDEITLPRASSPELIPTDSLSRMPVFPVRLFRSDPARSTRCSFDTTPAPRRPAAPPAALRRKIVKIACDRLDRAFIPVLAVARRPSPLCSTLRASEKLSTGVGVKFATWMPPSADSLTQRSSVNGGSRLRKVSLYSSRYVMATDCFAVDAEKMSRSTRGATPACSMMDSGSACPASSSKKSA
eukprot:gene7573-biopygen7525